MKKEKATTIYPDAVRGPLKADKTIISNAPKRPLFRAQDRDPVTIIAMGAIAFTIIGFCMWVVTYLSLK